MNPVVLWLAFVALIAALVFAGFVFTSLFATDYHDEPID